MDSIKSLVWPAYNFFVENTCVEHQNTPENYI